jgi:hypothetical protein
VLFGFLEFKEVWVSENQTFKITCEEDLDFSAGSKVRWRDIRKHCPFIE